MSGEKERIPKPAKKRRSRADRALENREALLKSATAIIGEKGYEGATISEVTRGAGLSLGSFYQYFESRENLFRQLLPAMGAHLIDALAQDTHNTRSAVETEERAIRTYFDFVTADKPFMRVFKEAEVYAPEAYSAHMENVLNRYAKTLRRQQAQGDYAGFDAEELEAVALMLTYARLAFFDYYAANGEDHEWVQKVFVKIITALSRGV